MIVKQILVSIILILLSGCISNKQTAIHRNRRVRVHKAKKISKIMHIEIEDVECDICAQLVTEICSTLEGVHDVTYICADNNYQNGRVQLSTAPENNIDEEELRSKLSQEGFMLRSIKQWDKEI